MRLDDLKVALLFMPLSAKGKISQEACCVEETSIKRV